MSNAGGEALTTRASPEIELLLCCATRDLETARAANLRRLAEAGLAWERVLRLALHHRTMPLLYRHLNATCSDLLPTAFMERLHDHFYLNAARNHALNEELCRILKLLADQDIHAIPYKGPVLAVTAYGDLSLRQFNDLDLMTRPQDVPQVSCLLRQQGYEQQWHFTPAQEAAYLRSDCELLFAGDQGRVFLDVHWAFVRSYFSLKLDYERLWQRLQPVSLGCLEAQTFAPEDLLIILCVHASKDLWERLIWVTDVAELIAAHKDLDWEQVVKEARRFGVRRMLLLGLFLAHDLLSTELPKDVLDQVRAEPVVRTLAGKIRGRLFQDAAAPASPIAEYLFHFKLHETPLEKASFTFRFATTTNPADWNAVRLPDSLFFLYYLLRPLRLLRRQR